MDARILRTPHRRCTRGVSMIMAMMTLVILSLAAVTLVRSVDSNALLIGNLGFKQDATAASSIATEQALAWIDANKAGATLDASGAAGTGYFATSLDDLDVTGRVTSSAKPKALVDWLSDGCGYVDAANFSGVCVAPKTVNVALGTGNSAKYVIMRMCQSAGAMAAGNTCSRPRTTATSTAFDRGALSPGGRITAPVTSPYFRVVVRVQGPHNTVSFTETIVHL